MVFKQKGVSHISSKKSSLKKIAGKKLDNLEEYAIHSDVAKKLAMMIYKSDIYNYISKKINSSWTCSNNHGWKSTFCNRFRSGT